VYAQVYIIFSAGPQPQPRIDASNDAVWSKEVPFWGLNDENLSFGGQQPKQLHYFGVNREIPAKTRLLNVFLTMRNTPIVVMYD